MQEEKNMVARKNRTHKRKREEVMTERKRETLLSRKGKEKYFHKGKGESEGKEDNRGCCLLSPQVEGRGRT